jgi:site-specific recombinase XerD
VHHDLQPQPPRPTDFVVSLADGNPIDPDHFAKWMKQTAAEAGVNVSPHRLRHTAATTMLNKVGSLEEVSSLLGHADIKTTSIYARITPDTRHTAAKALGSVFDKASGFTSDNDASEGSTEEPS